MMRRHLSRFWSDDTAAVSIEAVIILPVLLFFYVASFIFFDAFRVYTTSVKATYAIADYVTRQTDYVRPADVDGLNRIFLHLTRNRSGSDIRISQILRATAGYEVEWSEPTGTQTRLRTSDLADYVDTLPIMEIGERVIMVETRLTYVPVFDVGVTTQIFENVSITRPRFAAQVPFRP